MPGDVDSDAGVEREDANLMARGQIVLLSLLQRPKTANITL